MLISNPGGGSPARVTSWSANRCRRPAVTRRRARRLRRPGDKAGHRCVRVHGQPAAAHRAAPRPRQGRDDRGQRPERRHRGTLGQRTRPTDGPPGAGQHTGFRYEVCTYVGRSRSCSACGAGRRRTDRRSSRRPGGTPPRERHRPSSSAETRRWGRDQVEELGSAGNGGPYRPGHGAGQQRRRSRLPPLPRRCPASGAGRHRSPACCTTWTSSSGQRPETVRSGRVALTRCEADMGAEGHRPGEDPWLGRVYPDVGQVHAQPGLEPRSDSRVNGLTASGRWLLPRSRPWLAMARALTWSRPRSAVPAMRSGSARPRHWPVTVTITGCHRISQRSEGRC